MTKARGIAMEQGSNAVREAINEELRLNDYAIRLNQYGRANPQTQLINESEHSGAGIQASILGIPNPLGRLLLRRQVTHHLLSIHGKDEYIKMGNVLTFLKATVPSGEVDELKATVRVFQEVAKNSTQQWEDHAKKRKDYEGSATQSEIINVRTFLASLDELGDPK